MGEKKIRTAKTTKRKKPEGLSSISDSRFRQLYDNMLEGCMLIGYDWTYLYVNETAARHGRRKREDLIGRTILEMYPGVEKSAVFAGYKRCMEERIHQYYESVYVFPDGVTNWYEFRVEPTDEGIFVLSLDITERKRTEVEKEQYYKLVKTSADLMVIADPNGAFMKTNPACTETLGYTEAELVAKPFIEFVHPDDKQSTLDEMARQLQKGFSLNFENRYICKDGSVRWLSWRATYTKDEGITYATARDITKRKQAEEDRDRILTLSQDIICIAGTDGFMKYINPACESILGYTQKEFISKRFYEFVYPDDRRKTEEEVDKLAAGRITVDFDNRYMHKDGSLRTINWRATPMPEKGLMYCVGRDITRRRKAEQFVRDILESVNEEFIVIDPEYRIVSANKAYCLYAQQAEADIVGKHCYEVTHHASGHCYELGGACPVKLVFATGEPHTALHTHTDSEENHLYMEIRAYPMKNAEGGTISVIETITDITEKKKLEDQLRQAQKMEAIGQIAGGVAHDFNNILSAIVGYGYLLQTEIGHDDPLRMHVDQILAASERAATLTHSLLAFSRKQAMSLKPASLNEIVRHVEKFLKRLIGEDIEFKSAVIDDELTAEADSSQIEQVLMNLATNARDAMPHGGCLTMNLDSFVIDHEFIRAHGFGEPGRYAVMTMTDTGSGMDEKTRQKIFDPFFTTKDPGKGTGLGLAIVYGIVKQHKGYINVYSEPGKGTCFRIYIPLIKAKVEDVKPAVSAPPPKGTELVLIAEDDAPVRELTRIVLEAYGYKVVDAMDGEDAIRKFNKNSENVKLVILDLIMPKKSGREVYEEIRKSKPDMKVLFVSGYTADRMKAEGIMEEGVESLQKPVAPRDLLKKVREVLDR